MEKIVRKILCFISMVLIFALVTGCSGDSSPDLEGYWDNDDAQMSLYIGDTIFVMTASWSEEFEYENDGETLELSNNWGSSYTLFIEGDTLVMDDLQGTFVKVDDASYTPEITDEEDEEYEEVVEDSTLWYGSYTNGDGNAKLIFEDSDFGNCVKYYLYIDGQEYMMNNPEIDENNLTVITDEYLTFTYVDGSIIVELSDPSDPLNLTDYIGTFE